MLDIILGRKKTSSSHKKGLGYDSIFKTTSLVEVNTKLSVNEDEGRSRNRNEEMQEHNNSS